MRVACNTKKGHIAPSLSCLDILTVLYYTDDFADDTIILSKGHGCYGLYAIQADKGMIDKSKWETFDLPGCLEGFGSLGHGLPIAVGLGFGRKLQNKPGHIFCIVGDGEMQEGSMWEALSFMYHHGLYNVSVIIDNNGLQAMDKIDNVLTHNLFNRLEGWGFHPEICDGHNHHDIYSSLKYRPQILIANTIKGYGYKCMANKPEFHYRVPNDKQK